jgi:hypothetical protein
LPSRKNPECNKAKWRNKERHDVYQPLDPAHSAPPSIFIFQSTLKHSLIIFLRVRSLSNIDPILIVWQTSGVRLKVF